MCLALSSSFPATPSYLNMSALLPCLTTIKSMQIEKSSHYMFDFVPFARSQSP